jgi:hypothetical protein
MPLANTETPQIDQEYYKEVVEVAQSLLRRSLMVIERYAQFICNDLNDRGLKTEMRSRIVPIDEGICLTVEFVPSRKCILDAVKRRPIRKLIKRYEKELKRMSRRVAERELRQMNRSVAYGST